MSLSSEKLDHFDGEPVHILDADRAFANGYSSILVDEEASHDIKLRTMSWQKAMYLLFGDQVCLAIMAQAWSFMVLGWVPALIVTFLAGALFWISSLTMWKYLMKHPHIVDVCELGASLFGGSRLAYEWTGFMLLANNILLIGFHVFTGARVINTLSDGANCTIIYSVGECLNPQTGRRVAYASKFVSVVTVIGILLSLPRTLNHVSIMSIFSAICMGIAILLFLIFAGIEDHPSAGYKGVYPTAGAKVYTTAFPADGVSWVDCVNAVLNITFLWVPQILFPTFIAEMERPQDFPKALAGLAGMSFVLFIVVPIVGYRYLGQYATAPSFGSLEPVYKKASFAFVIVPTIVIGVIYCNVAAKYIYGRLMKNSVHAHSNTKLGWGVWVAVVTGIWALSFILGSVIPSMGDFLSLLGAAFDSFFGFIYWALAYWHLYKTELFSGPRRTVNTLVHIFMMACGLFLLGPGLYAAVEAIITDYAGSTRPAFSCASNSI
ncbi:hypothetical protein P7C73_g3340, partial [Tremellales sp. Uapishka_1]